MRRFSLILLCVNLIITSTLAYFYYRDAIKSKNLSSIGECTPYNVTVKEVKKDSIALSWNTKNECVGMVKFGDSPESTVLIATSKKGLNKSKAHEVEISDLQPSSTYYFVFMSGENTYGFNGVPLALKTSDITAL